MDHDDVMDLTVGFHELLKGTTKYLIHQQHIIALALLLEDGEMSSGMWDYQVRNYNTSNE